MDFNGRLGMEHTDFTPVETGTVTVVVKSRLRRRGQVVSSGMTYPPRIKAFRDDIIVTLPRAPNNKASLEAMHAMPTRQLISALVNWRRRLIPAKPRKIAIWSGGVKPHEFQTSKARLRPLLDKVEAGSDLRPHLSEQVGTKGIVLPGASPAARRQDIDMVLTRHGLHHFHVGTVGRENPKGRSGGLLFAEVLEKEFRIVAISDHRAFESGSPENLRFFGICQSYMAKDVPPGQAFMLNPVVASGHSMLVQMFGLKCGDEIQRLDPLLDDPEFIDKLYNGQPVLRDGVSIERPQDSAMAWHLEDMEFGILDRRTSVFFNIFPFFGR